MKKFILFIITFGLLVADFSLIQSRFWEFIICAVIILAGSYVSLKIDSEKQCLNGSNEQLDGCESEEQK